ncbi:inorganic triphosphatase [Curvivirga sp.]|uniref:CYTH domain-containing protein n=1 Tax=Curvivirga sp. TaxID=2856848 RepID=UPI003B5C7358
MGIEIELKLDFTPENLRRFRKWSGLRDISIQKPKRACLRACYYDTSDWELVKQKSSLRIRREYGKWVQTAKLALPSSNMSKRVEINWDISSPNLDLGLETENQDIRQALKSLHDKKIVEVFRTRIWRTARILRYKNSEIELAIDSGHIFAGEKSVVVSEAELELMSGNAEDLMDLAKEWQQIFKFTIDGASKAERGYKLAA